MPPRRVVAAMRKEEGARVNASHVSQQNLRGKDVGAQRVRRRPLAMSPTMHSGLNQIAMTGNSPLAHFMRKRSVMKKTFTGLLLLVTISSVPVRAAPTEAKDHRPETLSAPARRAIALRMATHASDLNGLLGSRPRWPELIRPWRP